MHQPVGEQQQRCPDGLVVGSGLPGYLLRDGYAGRLALHQQQGLAGGGEGEQVGALAALVVA